jgi:phage protein D
LLIAENTLGLFRCEALFGNWGTKEGSTDFIYFDRKVLDFGKTFAVKLGEEPIFEGKILGLEGNFPEGQAPELNILAEDRFQDLRMTRRTRSFFDISDEDVIRQIANEHGLTPNVALTGPQHKVLAQINQSDLAFLRERARTLDAEIWIDGTELHAETHAERKGKTVELSYGAKLREFSVLADLAGQRTSVIVSGWDVAAKSEIKYEATDAAIRGELNGDASGAHLLGSAFGSRKESLTHSVPFTNQEAQAEAETFFKMAARRFVVGRGVADPDSRLRVGSYVDLQRLGMLFSGKYYLSEVRYLFDGARGLRVEFTAERPGLGQAH